jgi:hypothetical protein
MGRVASAGDKANRRSTSNDPYAPTSRIARATLLADPWTLQLCASNPRQHGEMGSPEQRDHKAVFGTISTYPDVPILVTNTHAFTEQSPHRWGEILWTSIIAKCPRKIPRPREDWDRVTAQPSRVPNQSPHTQEGFNFAIGMPLPTSDTPIRLEEVAGSQAPSGG